MNCHICPINHALTRKDKRKIFYKVISVITPGDHRWRPITALVSSICCSMYCICVLQVIPYWAIDLFCRPHRDIRWCPFYFDFWWDVGAFRRHRSYRSNKRILENKTNSSEVITIYMRKLEIRIGKAHCSWYSFHSENNKWAVLSVDLRFLLLLVPSAHQLHSGAVPSPPMSNLIVEWVKINFSTG